MERRHAKVRPEEMPIAPRLVERFGARDDAVRGEDAAFLDSGLAGDVLVLEAVARLVEVAVVQDAVVVAGAARSPLEEHERGRDDALQERRRALHRGPVGEMVLELAAEGVRHRA